MDFYFILLYFIRNRSQFEIRNWKFMLSYFCAVDKRIQFWTKFFNYYFEPFCSTCQNRTKPNQTILPIVCKPLIRKLFSFFSIF